MDLVDKLLGEFKNDPELWAEIWVANIAEDLCRFMEDRNLTKSELARQMCVDKSVITRVMKGQTNITALTLTKIAVALGQTPVAVRWISVAERIQSLSGTPPVPICAKTLTIRKLNDNYVTLKTGDSVQRLEAFQVGKADDSRRWEAVASVMKTPVTGNASGF